MAQRAQPAHAEDNKQQLSPQETSERKQRVLTKRTPSVVRSIADAIVIKDEDLFFLCAPDGNVPLDEGARLRSLLSRLLPKWTDWVEVRRLKVGAALVDLRFEQSGDRVALEVLAVDGELEVVVEPDGAGWP